MLVSSWENLLPIHILVMWVMFQDSFGIFWRRKHPSHQKMLVLLAQKIAAMQVNCVSEQRQMARESVLFQRPGIFLASQFLWIWILMQCIPKHHWLLYCIREISISQSEMKTVQTMHQPHQLPPFSQSDWKLEPPSYDLTSLTTDGINSCRG